MNDHNAQLFLQAQAEMVRVEGMKADNQVKVATGNYPQFDISDFEYAASEIGRLAQEFTQE